MALITTLAVTILFSGISNVSMKPCTFLTIKLIVYMVKYTTVNTLAIIFAIISNVTLRLTMLAYAFIKVVFKISIMTFLTTSFAFVLLMLVSSFSLTIFAVCAILIFMYAHFTVFTFWLLTDDSLKGIMILNNGLSRCIA